MCLGKRKKNSSENTWKKKNPPCNLAAVGERTRLSIDETRYQQLSPELRGMSETSQEFPSQIHRVVHYCSFLGLARTTQQSTGADFARMQFFRMRLIQRDITASLNSWGSPFLQDSPTGYPQTHSAAARASPHTAKPSHPEHTGFTCSQTNTRPLEREPGHRLPTRLSPWTWRSQAFHFLDRNV